MKKLLSALALWALAASVALAQQPGINTVPQIGINVGNLRANTYSAISAGLVPAASATDIFCIAGSATKTIFIHDIGLSGTAGTAITTPVVALRRVALDTGGTAATGIALPVAARVDSSEPASTATLTAYTANPTINDASPTYVWAQAIPFLVTTGGAIPVEYLFGTTNDFYDQGLVLRGAAQQLCLNLNGVSISSGVLAISIEWVEQ